MKRRTLWLALGIGVPLLVCGGGGFAVSRVIASTSLEKELAAMKSHGIPTTVEELRVLESGLGGEDNAAPGYTAVFDALEERRNPVTARIGELERTRFEGLEELVRRAELALWVPLLQPHFTELRKISRASGVKFEHRWEDVLQVHYQELSGFKQARRLLPLSAKVKFGQGDELGALEDLKCLLRMAVHVRSIPGTTPLYCSIAMERTAMDMVREILSRSRLRETYVAVDKLLDELPVYDLRRSIASEVVWADGAVRHLANPPSRSADDAMCGTAEPEGLILACKLRATRDGIHARLIKPFRLACDQVPAKPKSLREIYEGLERAESDPQLKDLVYEHLLWSLAEKDLSGVAEMFRALDSSRKVTRAAVNVGLGRPAPPDPDPLTSWDFAFRHEAQGTRIYGFGPDKIDEKGEARWEGAIGVDDIVVVVPRVLRG